MVAPKSSKTKLNVKMKSTLVRFRGSMEYRNLAALSAFIIILYCAGLQYKPIYVAIICDKVGDFTGLMDGNAGIS